MINEYTFGESGVRELEKLIEKIVDKIAYKIVSNEEKLPIIISK